MTPELRAWLERVAKGALSAAVSAAVVYVVGQWSNVPLEEPYKSLVALIAVALYNRLRGRFLPISGSGS